MSDTAKTPSKRRQDLADVLRVMRTNQGWSRGQVARRMTTSATVVYNLESARSRITINYFFGWIEALGKHPGQVLGRHLFSIRDAPMEASHLIATFRKRLRLTQKAMAALLGYKRAAMVHHFEKGLRQPDLIDLIKLMEEAGDNVRGFILELTGSDEIAERFPAGEEARRADWEEYWAHWYIQAIRQIMRTQNYRDRKRFRRGMFADLLEISLNQENHALNVLHRFDVIRYEGGKPEINPASGIVMPRDINPKVISQLKLDWSQFGQRQFLRDKTGDRTLLSMDILPANAAMLQIVREKIRAVQDEIHGLEMEDSDGFIQLAWQAAYLPIG